MKETTIVTIDKLARSTGGDRYQGILMGKPWQIYLPQHITRNEHSKPVKEILITVETKED